MRIPTPRLDPPALVPWLRDLLRRVDGVYAAVLRVSGETVAEAGAHASWGDGLAPFALALVEGGRGVSGPSGFHRASVVGESRALHVYRIGPEHLLCLLVEPGSPSAPLRMESAVGELRARNDPQHDAMQRIRQTEA